MIYFIFILLQGHTITKNERSEEKKNKQNSIRSKDVLLHEK